MLKKLSELVISIWIWFFVAFLTVAVTFPIAFCSIFLAPFDPQRKCAHQIGNFWGKTISKVNPFWKFHINGKENVDLRRNYVMVCNHSSMADIICLYTLGMQFKWMAKTSLFKIPFFGWSMGFMKYIPLERGSHGSIRKSYDKARHWLEQGMSVLIFPEGTRSRDGSLGEFKNGAFKLAIETHKPILPIAITGSNQAIAKGKATVGRKVSAILSVLSPIDTKDCQLKDFENLKNQARSSIKRELEKSALSLST